MTALPDELRLAYLALLSVVVFACAVWFARRMVGGDWIETLLDALLITLVIQYASVCLPGLFGALDVWSMSVTAVLGCALLGAVARDRPPPPRDPDRPRTMQWPAVGLVVFVTVYLLVAISKQWVLPPIANDPLTYHLPAAVEWLQGGRITLHETWFYNPANTYSPLAGSALMAWWLAPMSSDVLARFAQAPALLLLMLAMIQIVRSLGVSTTVAALVAAGAVCSRLFISQAILAKDDLFVAAFFTTAVASLTRVKLSDALGPWRVGLALGMLLAMKYTALLTIPILVLAVDAPLRAGWKLRDWFLAAICAFALAGPWYLRNAMLTGNPLFPIHLPGFEGLFATRRSDELASIAGLWKTFVTGYYSSTIPVAALLVLVWLGAMVTSWRHLMRTPLVRTCLLGPPIGIVLFVLFSPYAEVRFIYPSLLLMFACAGLLGFALKSAATSLLIGVVVPIAGVATGFVPEGLRELLPMTVAISVFSVLIAATIERLPEPPRGRVITGAAVVVVAIVGCLVYIYFEAFLRAAPRSYANLRERVWRDTGYGELAAGWDFVREHVPAGATIAYANTFYTYPLYGFDLTRRVLYAPTRADISHLHDLPPAPRALSGAEIVPYVASQLSAEPDERAWLENLTRAGADYLIVAKPGAGAGTSAPEIDFARMNPDRFQPVFENGAAVVYRIVEPSAIPTTNPSGAAADPGLRGLRPRD